MARNTVFHALIALALVFGAAAAARAAVDQQQTRHGADAGAEQSTREFAAQSHPHVTIRPRYRATRHCRAWLAKEYRVSGPVIVPHKYCWWQ
jgi:hypothetical protein